MSWAANGLNTIHAAGAGGIGGWVELGRTTLGSVGDTITVSSLSDKRYYMVLSDTTFASGNIGETMRFNNDSGTNYAVRNDSNGGGDSTVTSQTDIDIRESVNPQFSVSYIANRSANEKLMIAHAVNRSTAGATTAPVRREVVGKWANTSNAINRIDIVNDQSGDFGTGAECVVLGWDPADTHTNNFWAELASVSGDGVSTSLSTGTISAKKYLWVQGYSGAAVQNFGMQFNNDTSTNYASRENTDGGTDSTLTSQSTTRGCDNSPYFYNCFIINNSANEKLGIQHTIRTNTGSGAANAPARQEHVFKWANTSNQITEIDFVQQSTSVVFGTEAIFKVWGAN